MTKNKLVSYCLFTFNQEKYIKASLESVLNQTYSPLEIIISDDCSSDQTIKVVEKILQDYNGPHKIIFNKNKQNLGIGGHFSKVSYSIATGEYIIVLGGDDIADREHTAKAVAIIEENPSINMVDFNADIIDEKGSFVKAIDLDFNSKKFTLNNYLKVKKIQHFAAGRIFRRKLIQSFDPILKKCRTEDMILVFRSLLTGGFIRSNTVLIRYRKHDSSLSSPIGLSKFSNFAIISQHIVDIIHLYNKGLIEENHSLLLIKRINLELKLRNLRFSTSKNHIHAKLKLMYADLLKYIFLIQNH